MRALRLQNPARHEAVSGVVPLAAYDDDTPSIRPFEQPARGARNRPPGVLHELLDRDAKRGRLGILTLDVVREQDGKHPLLHRHALREVSRLVDVAPAARPAFVRWPLPA